MKKNIFTFVLAATISTITFAEPSVGVKISTLGVGIEIQSSISDKSIVRLGHFGFSADKEITESNIGYDAKFSAGNTLLAVDYFIGSTPYRVSAGLVNFSDSISLTAKPTGTGFDLAGNNVIAANIESLTGVVGIKGTVPYLGVGIASTPDDEGFGFSLDIGASTLPDVTASLSVVCSTLANLAGTCSTIESYVDEENAQLEAEFDGISKNQLFPVISTGISYKF
jgi:hypothetical protein